jgi:hypothetical protein
MRIYPSAIQAKYSGPLHILESFCTVCCDLTTQKMTFIVDNKLHPRLIECGSQ